ncbi:UDP-N-acetylmuramoylalanyl-D-glutamate--2,6-diaminopimelate ligase [Seinonella peptonophila]|uniref:UDP-N-acetylmuramoyl-L-alanyl-D-glutamate--2,6-diaminopimelate ligase n=1 Tax=Seinonella peptonophila TaxID=112248 RepID=A0A1M4T2Z4_9BACL|nr:UDP-N-acetylmuramoyl-L-alanyl-D-glutamate--2,6-diaminopimelate ligase [Seinonella peptonophila]SHE38667.1 UDP-N-acetylmuramoylalanyl-D-glutamate--2,6-diaminopimelate ligase [Seinonella peptonophila]
MKLKKLLLNSSYKILQGNLDIEITDIAFDSRKVKSGALFVCIPGFQVDGHDFISQAVEKGASALVVEKDVSDIPEHITVIQVDHARQALPQLSHLFYGRPTEKVNLIGITGTNGKTSVSFLISKILSTAGRTVGLAGTIRKQVGEKVIPFHTTTPTTPESSDLQRLFKMMVREGAEDIVMEVSSIALEQGRVDGCRFKVGVFTNLSPDHLDDHGTMENYKRAKMKLFNRCEYHVINRDDKVAEEILAMATGSILTYGIEHEEVDLKATHIAINAEGVRFTMEYQGEKVEAAIAIPGKFSVYNALAAAAACIPLGLSLEEIAKGLAAVEGVRGRFENVPIPSEFHVIVDYAHSPDALENVLHTIRDFVKGRVITIFGCGGDRDPSKRPLMGKIAGELSDLCILTSDNPRTEEPETILNHIEVGIKETQCQYVSEVDRRKAIGRGLQMAKEGDVVLIAGKGHEDYQEVNGEKMHFDDVEEVKNWVKQQENVD